MSTNRALKDVIECMVNAADDDEYAQAIEIELSLLTLKFDISSLDDEIESCSFSVLCQMYSNLDNERLQKRGRKLLQDLEDAHKWHCLDFFDGKLTTREIVPVIQATVRFIELHHEDASGARFGFDLIRNVISKGGAPYSKVSQHTVNVAVDSMIRHVNDPVVQEYVMVFLWDARANLGHNPNALHLFLQAMRNHPDNSNVQLAALHAIHLFQNKLSFEDNDDDEDILDLFLQAMRNHPENSNVQLAALRAIFLFHDKYYGLILSVEWLPATILQALNNHVHCAEVQESACDCLGYLVQGVKEGLTLHDRDFEANLPLLGEKELFLAGQDYIEAILQTMQTHPTNEKVQSAALRVLDRMSYKSASLDRIIQGGGVDLVLRAMHTFEGGEACLRAVMVLKPLLGCSTDARREAIELGAIPVLLSILMRHRGSNYGTTSHDFSRSISWCVVVCDALNQLFLENNDNAVSLQIAKEGGISLIVDSIVHSVGKNVHLRENIARPVRLPSSGNINHILDQYEFKDGDILAHLAMFPGNDGKLPLHCVVDRGHSYPSEGQMAVLEHLLKVYPEAATVRDGSGRLPLHIAIESSASLSVLELLLRANPDAGEAVCRCPDDMLNYFNFPPVLMAAAHDCDLECIFALLRFAPSITKRQAAFISRKRKSPPP